MFVKISSIGFSVKKVKYHNSCKRKDLNIAMDPLKARVRSIIPTFEELESHVQAIIFRYPESSVIRTNHPEYLVSLRRYCRLLAEEAVGIDIDVVPQASENLSCIRTF